MEVFMFGLAICFFAVGVLSVYGAYDEWRRERDYLKGNADDELRWG